MRRRWPVAVALGAGVAAAGAGVALLRASRRWRVPPGAVAAEDRTLPSDVVEHLVTTDDGGRIRAVERGEGPPIVLVHGVTLGVGIWAPQLRRLADEGHRVIAVDQRGHGKSLAGQGGYSLERLADDLVAVLEHLDVHGALLVGHSMGGMVAQLLAVHRPEAFARHVAGLVLVATAAGPLIPGPGSARLAAGFMAGADAGLQRADRRGQGLFPYEGLGPVLARLSFGAHPDPGDIELTRSMIAAMSPAAMAGLLPGIVHLDIRGRITAITVPTWVVVGSRDTLTPPRLARVMAAAIPGARLVVLPGCGHMVMLEREKELHQILAEASAETAAAPT